MQNNTCAREQAVVRHGWWESFCKHHSHFTLRTTEKLSYIQYVPTKGNVLPPLLIFATKSQLTHGEVPGRMYGLRIVGGGFRQLVFSSPTPAVGPLLLLLDGHSTHYNPFFVRKAA